MRKLAALLFLSIGCLIADSTPPVLLQKPTLNKTHIVFVYAGDLWSVPRDGGEARRLTTGPGLEDESGLLARRIHHRIYRRI